MNKNLVRRKPKKVTVRGLHSKLRRLRTRVDDLEDLRDLNAAIERNSGKPGIPWSRVKKELGYASSQSSRDIYASLGIKAAKPRRDRAQHVERLLKEKLLAKRRNGTL